MAAPATDHIDRLTFMEAIEPFLTPHELENVAMAYEFAKAAHRNQVRDGGERYFEHPKAVAWILIKELKITDWQLICMALLHDVAEDSFMLSWSRLEKLFGRKVTLGVKLLTKKPKEGYMDRLRQAAPPGVILVKLCDRVHNLRTLGDCNPVKQSKQCVETRREYIPLADLLKERLPKKDRWRSDHLKIVLTALCAQYEVPQSLP